MPRAPGWPVHIALYQPDIPQNAGTIVRLGACLGVPVAIVEPAGFPTSDRAFRRAGMDYLDRAILERHVSYAAFDAWRRTEGRRLVLFTTGGDVAHVDVRYRVDDVLMFGRESAGVPDAVHADADIRAVIPVRIDTRSLNVAVAAAIALGEALRQTSGFPPRATAGRD